MEKDSSMLQMEDSSQSDAQTMIEQPHSHAVIVEASIIGDVSCVCSDLALRLQMIRWGSRPFTRVRSKRIVGARISAKSSKQDLEAVRRRMPSQYGPRPSAPQALQRRDAMFISELL